MLTPRVQEQEEREYSISLSLSVGSERIAMIKLVVCVYIYLRKMKEEHIDTILLYTRAIERAKRAKRYINTFLRPIFERYVLWNPRCANGVYRGRSISIVCTSSKKEPLLDVSHIHTMYLQTPSAIIELFTPHCSLPS